jgi:hypothetical protein
MQKRYLILALIIYLASAGASYAIFSRLSPREERTQVAVVNDSEETELGLLLNIDPNEPKDQACPINGALYTQTERDAWEQRRPLFVMIENSPDSRPHSGLSRADVVFEAVAEGGVTRYGAVFYCAAQRKDVTIAPVRSARTYFVDWASGFNFPLFVNVGGANLPGPTDALGQIRQYGWEMQNNLSQFSIGFPTFVRNNNRLGRPVATEHTMETTSEQLWKVAEKRNWTNTDPKGNEWIDDYQPWVFGDSSSAGSVSTVSYGFWSGYNQYSVDWEYDAESNKFLRTLAGKEDIDLNNDERIAAANVIVLKTTERGPINELKHMIYTTIGTGKALIFKNGDVVEANWSKPTRVSQIRFTDNRGNDIELARGLTWISVVGLGNEVVY